MKSKSINEYKDTMTITEVANYLRISNLTLKRWEKKNKIPYTRVSLRGERIYKKIDLVQFIDHVPYK